MPAKIIKKIELYIRCICNFAIIHNLIHEKPAKMLLFIAMSCNLVVQLLFESDKRLGIGKSFKQRVSRFSCSVKHEVFVYTLYMRKKKPPPLSQAETADKVFSFKSGFTTNNERRLMWC